MTELAIVAVQLEQARCPEEVFGFDPAALGAAFKHILRVVHPDRNPSEPALAQAVTQRLLDLKKEADERAGSGEYGKGLPLPEYATTEIGGHVVLRKPVIGSVADVYRGPRNAHGGACVVKVARSADDNDLMRAERRTLTILNKKVMMPVRAGFPTLLTGFQVGGREANVLEALPEGFVDMGEVHRRKAVVEPRALVWMFKRVLSVLDWTHHCGFVHGAVLPPHVFVYPDNDGTATNPHPYKHTVRLIGWCCNVEYASRTRLSAWSPEWRSHYPPELLEKREVLPASDIYMAAALVDWLGGRDGRTPQALRDVLRKCLLPKLSERYQSCGEVFQAWVLAAEQAYGPAKWADFNL